MELRGEIRMFAGDFAPAGWAFCDGSLLSISENDELFMLIGTTYGGDGENTFALPDLRSRVPIAFSQHHAIGDNGGVEAVTLTQNQLPKHMHVFLGTSSIANDANPSNNVVAQSNTGDPYQTTAPTAAKMAAGALEKVGSSYLHENRQPFIAVSYIISLYGKFPVEERHV